MFYSYKQGQRKLNTVTDVLLEMVSQLKQFECEELEAKIYIILRSFGYIKYFWLIITLHEPILRFFFFCFVLFCNYFIYF